jgi:hypothetical protein
VLLIGYGIENISSGEMQLATVVLFAAIISGGNYLFLCKTGNYSVASLVILLMMTCFVYICYVQVEVIVRDHCGRLFYLPSFFIYSGSSAVSYLPASYLFLLFIFSFFPKMDCCIQIIPLLSFSVF